MYLMKTCPIIHILQGLTNLFCLVDLATKDLFFTKSLSEIFSFQTAHSEFVDIFSPAVQDEDLLLIRSEFIPAVQ